MAALDLETVTKVLIYSIEEHQLVTELDSPAIGVTQDVAEEIALFKWYSFKHSAVEKILQLQGEYMERNSTLQRKNSKKDYALDGSIDHKYAHEYSIRHTINRHELKPEKIDEKIKALLEAPRKIVIKRWINTYAYQIFTWMEDEESKQILDTLKHSLL